MSLRERKKEKTRREVRRQALRLFLERGYEATTVEQIASAAEISQATFYRYFHAKEDVLFNDEYDPFIEDAFNRRPADEPLADVVRNVFREFAAQLMEADRDALVIRRQLMSSVPDLQRRLLREASTNIEQLAGLIAQRTGRDARDFDVRLASAAVNAVFAEAALYWLQHEEQPPLTDLIERGLSRVTAVLAL